MRPYVVGGPCHRVAKQIDAALSEGALELSPELVAHASRCPHCGPQVRETEALFRRLRSAPANLDMGPVPGVVDTVLQRITEPPPPTPIRQTREEGPDRRKQGHLRWLAGQVAAIAAVLFIAVGGLTLLALKLNHAVGGDAPTEVVQRWVAPFQDWSQAIFKRNTR